MGLYCLVHWKPGWCYLLLCDRSIYFVFAVHMLYNIFKSWHMEEVKMNPNQYETTSINGTTYTTREIGGNGYGQLLHCETGPAVIRANGVKCYFLEGKQYSYHEWKKIILKKNLQDLIK